MTPDSLSLMRVSFDIVKNRKKEGVLLPHQCHSKKIVKVTDGKEDLSDCDGLITSNRDLTIGVLTADCAPICIADQEKVAVVHAGWQGLCAGVVEEALSHFNNSEPEPEPEPEVWVGPHIKRFEVQKDECHDIVQAAFGDKFFTNEDGKLIFEFIQAVASLLPPHTKWDGRDTFADLSLPSYRRDGTTDRMVTMVKRV